MSGKHGVPLWRRVGKLSYAIALMAVLAYGGYCYYWLNQKFWFQLLDVRPSQMVAVAIASMLLVPWLDALDERIRRLGWSWTEWSLFSRNINFVPMDYSFCRVPFLVLLYFNLPVLAWVEEMMFRHNWFIHPTSGLVDALWRSALFGVLHVAAGTKVRSALPLTIGGLWFSWHYLYGGVETSTLAHLAMNTFGLTAMLVAWWKTGKNPFSY